MLRRAGLAFGLLAAAIVVTSCGGGGKSTNDDEPTRAPGAGAGSLIYARPDAIVELNIKSGATRNIITAPQSNSFLLDPAVSRDGAQLAYVMQPPSQIVDGRYDAGTDLWLAARDGSGARMLYQHTQPNALVRYPRWTPDGDIIAIIQEIEETPTITKVAYTAQRIDVETGARTKLLEDAYALAISPDGTRIAYARPLDAGGETFESVAIDGTGPSTEIVPQDSNLLPFNSPEYSPDGASIAFASADQSNAPPTPTPPTGELVSIARVSGTAADASSSATLDGLPQDIWLVDAAGGRPRLLAPLAEDLPSLTWSGDGQQIYVLGSTGLYEIDVGSAAVTRIGEGVFHGQVAWAP